MLPSLPKGKVSWHTQVQVQAVSGVWPLVGRPSLGIQSWTLVLGRPEVLSD